MSFHVVIESLSWVDEKSNIRFMTSWKLCQQDKWLVIKSKAVTANVLPDLFYFFSSFFTAFWWCYVIARNVRLSLSLSQLMCVWHNEKNIKTLNLCDWSNHENIIQKNANNSSLMAKWRSSRINKHQPNHSTTDDN